MRNETSSAINTMYDQLFGALDSRATNLSEIEKFNCITQRIEQDFSQQFFVVEEDIQTPIKTKEEYALFLEKVAEETNDVGVLTRLKKIGKGYPSVLVILVDNPIYNTFNTVSALFSELFRSIVFNITEQQNFLRVVANKTRYPRVLRAIAENASCDDHIHQIILDRGDKLVDAPVLTDIAFYTTSDRVLSKILEHKNCDDYIKFTVIQNDHASAHMLGQITATENRTLLLEITKNFQCDDEIRLIILRKKKQLVDTYNVDLLTSLIQNDFKRDGNEIVKSTQSSDVLSLIAAHPNCNDKIYLLIVANLFVSEETLLKVLDKTNHVGVMLSIVENPTISHETLIAVLNKTNDLSVRAAIANNINFYHCDGTANFAEGLKLLLSGLDEDKSTQLLKEIAEKSCYTQVLRAIVNLKIKEAALHLLATNPYFYGEKFSSLTEGRYSDGLNIILEKVSKSQQAQQIKTRLLEHIKNESTKSKNADLLDAVSGHAQMADVVKKTLPPESTITVVTNTESSVRRVECVPIIAAPVSEEFAKTKTAILEKIKKYIGNRSVDIDALDTDLNFVSLFFRNTKLTKQKVTFAKELREKITASNTVKDLKIALNETQTKITNHKKTKHWKCGDFDYCVAKCLELIDPPKPDLHLSRWFG